MAEIEKKVKEAKDVKIPKASKKDEEIEE